MSEPPNDQEGGDDHKKSRRKLFQDEANETKLNAKRRKEHRWEVEYIYKKKRWGNKRKLMIKD